nr:amidase domain-containing protein [Sulfobacillus harzensis]
MTPEEAQAKQILNQLVQSQQTAIISGRPQALGPLYAASSEAQEALQIAETRSRYLATWARLRQVKWEGVKVETITPAVAFHGHDQVSFYAVERERYTYRLKSHPREVLVFGIASRHYLAIIREDGRWKLSRDDFTNPVLPEDTAGLGVNTPYGGQPPKKPWGTHRLAAVTYADLYCGQAPGCGNQHRYNSDYRNYNGDGGDCTNFISQVLRAGGIRPSWSWNYDHSSDEGSGGWTNAGGLVDFLRDSGKATLVAEGSYGEVTRTTPQYPEGAIESLVPGDLISYQEHGRIKHSAVIVGYNPGGVPITDAHTNDRYHVPWDFGWSGKTTFYLWHIHYPDVPVNH